MEEDIKGSRVSKAYYLGAYDHIEGAIEARRSAVEQLFDGTASFYERWKERADADPEWAQRILFRFP